MSKNHGSVNLNAKGRPVFNVKAIRRVLKMLFSFYPVLFPVVCICTLFNAAASAIPAVFTQKIVEITEKWYVSGDWTSASAEILPQLKILVILYIISLIAIFAQAQLNAIMTQGYLSKMRKKLFSGMQDLPIRYFDTHRHGDIMSHYTNDIDTLRELVSQSLPALLRSGCIVAVVFCIMVWYSIPLTVLILLGIAAMTAVSGRLGGGSAKYFVRQQQSVAAAEGYIQEMMNGQKVVKVFCHESSCQKDFDALNDALCEDAGKAHTYASCLGPIIMNIGNILYVIIAVLGCSFLISGTPNLSIRGFFGGENAITVAVIVSFLSMTKQFTGNINQLSQQMNSIGG